MLNQKFYIGKHQCKNLNDGYLGSGIALVKAIKKYGKANFTREILFVFSTEEEMNAKEKELVTEALVADPNCYNLTLGGEGGPVFKGRHHSDKTKQLLRDKYKKVSLSEEQLLERYKKSKATRFEKYNSWNSPININSRKKLKESEINSWESEAHYCETCGKLMSIKYGSGRFCSKSCSIRPSLSTEKLLSRKIKAQNRVVSNETRLKVSEALKGKAPKNKNKIQITNDSINIYINVDDLDKYILEGWHKGNCKLKGRQSPNRNNKKV